MVDFVVMFKNARQCIIESLILLFDLLFLVTV